MTNERTARKVRDLQDKLLLIAMESDPAKQLEEIMKLGGQKEARYQVLETRLAELEARVEKLERNRMLPPPTD